MCNGDAGPSVSVVSEAPSGPADSDMAWLSGKRRLAHGNITLAARLGSPATLRALRAATRHNRPAVCMAWRNGAVIRHDLLE